MTTKIEQEVIDAALELQQWFNRVETTDSGNTFHPVTIGCCRVAWMEGLGKSVKALRDALNEYKQKQLEHGKNHAERNPVDTGPQPDTAEQS